MFDEDKKNWFKEFSKKHIRFFLFSTLALFVVILSVSTGITYFVESNDKFCASCHTQPETTYYQRSVKKETEDLATFHTKKNVHCIDCHSKPWFIGRLISQFQAFKNYLVHKNGKGKSFNKSQNAIGSEGCTKCHSSSLWSTERSGHHHSPIMQKKWQDNDGPQNVCESCHNSHKKVKKIINNIGFNQEPPRITRIKKLLSMDKKQVLVQCQKCHISLGKKKIIQLEYFE